ncbi:hypothetical protein LTR78_006113 [Recurvomyces mirabilis]|uniref:Rhodopsin domain-containing protein n=1 Tax=Recurvomyces mirabilis TaxID=574656 RepID=A0AAE1C0B2_9PEZI|nr:hypothetical protein LTR78_006113 [Recurvomyces mirabilis]KAK5151956.1 hypothetical protein LTS14_008730 [Recurvomyces mirabilis]
MSSFGGSPEVTQPKTNRISYTALLGVVWALTGLATSLVAARLAIHIKFGRRQLIDDTLLVLALCMLISNSIVTSLMAEPMYDLLKYSHGLLIPGPEFMTRSTFYLKCQFASTVLFWSCLWTVKACFLAFFYQLSNQTLWPRRFWWAVAVITAISYVGCVITYPLSCTSFVLGQCEKPINIYLSAVSLRFSTAVDMITDFLIIVIPLWLTIGLKMSLAQKMGLLGVLCLGVITMIFAAVRVVVTSSEGGVHPEITWLALWSGIETSVAVSVACMTSFRVLFTQLRHGSSYRSRSGPSNGHGIGTPNIRSSSGPKKSWRSGTKELDSMTDPSVEMENFARQKHARTVCVGAEEVEGEGGLVERDWPETASEERILPPESIRVQKTWKVSNA